MSGAEQIIRTLQNMDIPRLTKILSAAKDWIDQNYEQARDQLLDSPQLAYALYNIPEILDQKFQDLESGVDSFGNQRYQNSQSTLYPNQYRNSQMQGVFLDFQANADNSNYPQEQEQNHQQSVPPPQQSMQIPSQQSYEGIPQVPPQNVYYPPQLNMYEQVYQQPAQYSYPPVYNEPSSMPMQNQPQMSYSYGPVQQQEYAPTFEGKDENAEEEYINIALKLTPEQINALDDEETKATVMSIRKKYANRQPPQ